MTCRCQPCTNAREVIASAEALGFKLVPWQKHVIMNLAKCENEPVNLSRFALTARRAKRRIDQTPPWARPVVVKRPR